MALAFDATSGSPSWTTGSSINVTHICTGSNRVLFVGVAIYDASPITVSGITYNSIALTKINAITDNLTSANQDCELWYLDAPASGNNSLVITLSASATFVAYLSASYTGKTTSGIDADNVVQKNTSGLASPACLVNVVHSDCWLISFAYSRDGSHPTATVGTVRNTTDVGHVIGDSNGVIGTGNQGLHFSTSGSAPWPGVSAASFSAANAAAGTLASENGVSLANTSKLDSIAIASVKSFNGLTTGN